MRISENPKMADIPSSLAEACGDVAFSRADKLAVAVLGSEVTGNSQP